VAGDFGFQQVDAVGHLVFLEMRGGGEDVQFGGIIFCQRKPERPGERIVQGFQRAFRLAGENANLRNEQSRGQVVRRQLADAGEGGQRLTQQRQRGVLHGYQTILEAETGFIERSVGVDHLVPVAVFAELVGAHPREVNGGGGAGAQGPVEIKVDAGDDIVRIQVGGFTEIVCRRF
jgi:hypothetical protein